MSRAAKILDIPIVQTEQNPKALGGTVSELNAEPVISCAKTKFSMWTSEVEDSFKSNPAIWAERRNIVLFGIESHVCVLQTTMDLLERDFNVIVLADGVSSMNPGEIPIALDRMRAAGVIIASSESVLFQLVGDASLPCFKGISNLVKESGDSTKEVFEKLVQAKY